MESGHRARRLGNPSEAEKRIEKLVEVDPEREEAWFRIGYQRLLRGDSAGSIEPFRVCVSKRPDWLEALMNLGVAQRRLDDLEAAKASFTRGYNAPSGVPSTRCAG